MYCEIQFIIDRQSAHFHYFGGNMIVLPTGDPIINDKYFHAQ